MVYALRSYSIERQGGVSATALLSWSAKGCCRRCHEESNRAGFGHVYPLSELQAKVVGPLAFARHCRPFFIKLSGSATVRIYTFAARPFCADNVGISILLNAFPAKLGAIVAPLPCLPFFNDELAVRVTIWHT
jgi:hypothetical protein